MFEECVELVMVQNWIHPKADKPYSDLQRLLSYGPGEDSNWSATYLLSLTSPHRCKSESLCLV